MTKLRVLDLFSGIGGFSLGLERTGGFETVAFCEIEPYPRAVLKKHWPHVKQYDDVRTLTATQLAADGLTIDVICGGFPCQDISLAGNGAGLAGERSGLWREYARIIGELRPQFVIVENVAALLSRGLGDVLGDLATIGYDAEWNCIPASAVGAPHRRDRLWIIAHANSKRLRQQSISELGSGQTAKPQSDCSRSDASRERRRETGKLRRDKSEERLGGMVEDVADPPCELLNGGGPPRPQRRDELTDVGEKFSPFIGADWWLTEPDVGGTLDGFSSWMDELDMTEPLKSLLAYGNATKVRPVKAMRALRRTLGAPDDRGASGRSGSISPQEVLFAYLRKLEAYAADKARLQLARTETPRSSLRSVRPSPEPSGSSPGPKHREQRAEQHPDPLQALSRLLALHCQEAWTCYSRTVPSHSLNAWLPGWEDGVPRVAHGVPKRVDRLRALGNSVVPQIPELIGRAILQAEGLRA